MFSQTILFAISTTNTTTSSIFAPNLYLILSAAKRHGVAHLNYQKSQFSKINISTSYIDIRSIHNPISYRYYTTRFIGFNPIINSSKISVEVKRYGLRVETSPSYIGAIESTKMHKPISLKTLFRLADALDVHPSKLLED